MDWTLKHKWSFFILLLLNISNVEVNAQVKSSVDSTSIQIGQELRYTIEVETDTSDLVVFPEGQTFMPLEMIESYKIDTTKKSDRYQLIKSYGLTQFDSGRFVVPKQKIQIGTKTVFTDTLSIEVFNVEVDTTKQGLYDIKPFIQVERSRSNLWLVILSIILTLAVIAFALYWFIWRQKPLTEEAKIAMLPPYDRAKLALKALDESTYLQNAELKDYYSELTFIIRKYLDEKVYNRSLESTTDELITRLQLLKDGNQIELSDQDIKNLETILKRADLVKFAKSKPDVELAKLDRATIDAEIDHVKAALPEPTEEERLLDQQYKEEQERKKKRRKVILTTSLAVVLIILTFVGFGMKYGFNYVKDSIIGHDTKTLLEGDWVRSEYGIPPIMISTPEVLKRMEAPIPDEFKDRVKITAFGFGSVFEPLSISLSTTTLDSSSAEDEEPIDFSKAPDAAIRKLESNGVMDIIIKSDQFITPNAAEGYKTYGSARFPISNTSDELVDGQYAIFQFIAEGETILQQILITWHEDDDYTEDIVNRIINSIELKKEKE